MENSIRKRMYDIYNYKIKTGLFGGARKRRSSSKTSRKIVHKKRAGVAVGGRKRSMLHRKRRAGVNVGGRKRVMPHKRRAGVNVGGRKRSMLHKKRAGVYAGVYAGSSKSSRTMRRKTNPWIAYVKKFAIAHRMPYSEAILRAGPSYRAMH